MYDRTIKTLDEPHKPIDLERSQKAGQLHAKKFVNSRHSNSYLTQLKTIIDLDAKSVLEIGPGDSFSGYYLKNLGIHYDTMNLPGMDSATYQSQLETFNVSDLNRKYDLVAAFQVLEHSSYNNFKKNIEKLREMTEKNVFISLPYDCFGFSWEIRLGLGQKSKTLNLQGWLPTLRPNRRYRKEYMEEFPWAVHYWEIGRRGFPLKRIITDIESTGLRIVKKFHGKNPYHYFILAEKLAD